MGQVQGESSNFLRFPTHRKGRRGTPLSATNPQVTSQSVCLSVSLVPLLSDHRPSFLFLAPEAHCLSLPFITVSLAQPPTNRDLKVFHSTLPLSLLLTCYFGPLLGTRTRWGRGDSWLLL